MDSLKTCETPGCSETPRKRTIHCVLITRHYRLCDHHWKLMNHGLIDDPADVVRWDIDKLSAVVAAATDGQHK